MDKQVFKNEETFFEDVEKCLEGIGIDDFKANGSLGRGSVEMAFEWIFYSEDYPIDSFADVAKQIEERIMDRYSDTYKLECACYRYPDSLYTSDRGAYDVGLHIWCIYDEEEYFAD